MKKIIFLVFLLTTACQKQEKKTQASPKNDLAENTLQYCADDSRFYLFSEKKELSFYPVTFPNSWNKIKYFTEQKQIPPPGVFDLQDLVFSFYPDLKNKTRLLTCPWNPSHFLLFLSVNLPEKKDSVKIFLPENSLAGWRLIGGNCKYFSEKAPQLSARKYLLCMEIIPLGEQVPGKNAPENPHSFFRKHPNSVSVKYYQKNKIKTEKISLSLATPTSRDFGIMFLTGLALRYRQVLYQEELTEKLLFQMLERSDLPRKKEVRKYLRLLTLSENENFGI